LKGWSIRDDLWQSFTRRDAGCKLPYEAGASRVLLHLLFTCLNSVIIAFETSWPGEGTKCTDKTDLACWGVDQCRIILSCRPELELQVQLAR
jgi:hypothetical protein